MEEAGYYVEKLLGVEGPVWFMNSFSNHWKSPVKRALLLELLRTVEQDGYILRFWSARKPPFTTDGFALNALFR